MGHHAIDGRRGQLDVCLGNLALLLQGNLALLLLAVCVAQMLHRHWGRIFDTYSAACFDAALMSPNPGLSVHKLTSGATHRADP